MSTGQTADKYGINEQCLQENSVAVSLLTRTTELRNTTQTAH